jgi:acylpyruvate hydrolase
MAAAAAQKLLEASTKIIGVGRNYIAHAEELGNPIPKVQSRASHLRSQNAATLPTSLPTPSHAASGAWIWPRVCLGVLQEPVLFLKPTSSFLHAGVATAAVEIPEPLESLHHEVELAVVISRRGRDIPEASAMDFVGGNLRITSSS